MKKGTVSRSGLGSRNYEAIMHGSHICNDVPISSYPCAYLDLVIVAGTCAARNFWLLGSFRHKLSRPDGRFTLGACKTTIFCDASDATEQQGSPTMGWPYCRSPPFLACYLALSSSSPELADAWELLRTNDANDMRALWTLLRR